MNLIYVCVCLTSILQVDTCVYGTGVSGYVTEGFKNIAGSWSCSRLNGVTPELVIEVMMIIVIFISITIIVISVIIISTSIIVVVVSPQLTRRSRLRDLYKPVIRPHSCAHAQVMLNTIDLFSR